MLARSAARPVLATLVVCLAVIQSPPSAQAPTAGPLVVAPAGGGNPQVFVIEGTTTRTIQAYDPNFIGGVNASLGDVNGDGTMDIITGAGPFGGPHVRVLSGTDLSELASFYAYDPAFTGGVTVAAGDLDGDGRAEIITGAGPTGGPHVRAFSIGATVIEVASFYAYDPAFTGGVTVAAGDVNGDGLSDIITGAGPTGGPHVRVITGTTTPTELASYYAYDPAFTGGVRVAAGDINGDGLSDVVTAAGPTGAPLVRVITGTTTPTELFSFYAFDPTFTGGVYVATGDINADGRADLIVGAGPGGGAVVRVLSGVDLSELNSFVPPITGAGAVTVGSEGDAGVYFTSATSTTLVSGTGGTFTVTTAGFKATLVPTLTVTGTLPPGVTFADNGDGTATLAGTPAAGSFGDYSLTFTASNGLGAPRTRSFTLTVTEATSITSANATNFAIAVAGSFTVTTTGSPLPTITASGTLPTGVTVVDNGDGTARLAGTPGIGTDGTYPLTVTASNGVGAPAVQAFTLTVGTPQAPAITSASATAFTVAAAGSFTVTTTGAPAPALTIGGASLPFGVNFVDNGDGTGTLNGTPPAGASGTYALTFTAANGIGAPAVQNFTLTVNQGPAITSANAVAFTAGVPGTSFAVTTTGFPVPAITRGGVALPAGVIFVDNGNGTATLSGTPAAGTFGAYAISFTANNGVGAPVTQPFTLTVLEAPSFTSASATTFVVGTAGSFTVTTTGFPPASLTVGGASLPAIVSFVDNGNGTGTLSGTPAAGTAGIYAITFTATNGAGVPVIQNFTLTVGDFPTIDLDADDSGGTTGNDFAMTYAEGSPPQFIEDEVDATITDVDSPNLTSIVVRVTNVLDALQEKLDVDLVTGGFFADFTKVFDELTPGVAMLTIAAPTPQPLASFNTLLRRVTYQNLDTAPDTSAPRTITFVVNDGTGNGNTATTTVTITATDDPPTADNDSYTVAEGGTLNIAAPGVLDGDTDPEGDTPITAVPATGPANASAFTLNSDGSFTYTHNGGETTSDSFTYRAVANGLQSTPATVTITITAVNDAPAITAGGTLNFIEGGPAAAIDTTILVTDADSTNLTSATVQILPPNYVNGQDILAMPAAAGIAAIFNAPTGTLALTGTASVAAYQAALRSVTYFNNSATPSVLPRTVTWVVNDGTAASNTAASAITVTAVNSAPTGGADAWTTFGNTELVVDQTGPSTPRVADTTTSTFGVLDNDTDVEGDSRIVSGIVGCADTTAPFTDCATTAGGTVTMESNGRFAYRPQAGDTGTDTFQYTLTDQPAAGAPASVNVTVTLTLQERIWYVNGNVSGPGTGTSTDPFNALPATAGDADDFIFVHDSTVTGGITLQNGQKLYGARFGLSINQALNGNPAPVVLAAPAPASSPTINATTGNAVGILANTANGNRTNVEIRGLTLSTAAASSNAIDITTADAANVAVTISDVIVTGATAEGIDLNQASTGTATVAMSNVNVTSTGNGIDLNETAGTLTVTGFSGLTVTGDTGGSGIVVTNATFDATPGGAYQQVSGGTTAVGELANEVGAAGVLLTNVSGDLAFTQLDIFSGNGASLLLTGTGAVNVGAGTGTRVAIAPLSANFLTDGGPVVDVTNATIDLPLSSVAVVSSPTTGVSLVNVSGATSPVFSAAAGSIANTTGISFNVSGGNVSVDYEGDITHTSNAAMVSVSGGHTGGTISFDGTLIASAGPGLVFDNADSTTSYNFTGTTTLQGGDAGIDILNGSAGTFTFGTGTTITNPSGTAFQMSASNANVTYSGSISDNSGFAVDISGHAAGTVTFQTGSITSTGNGLQVSNNTGGSVNFNSPTISLTTGANKAVTLDVGNAGGTINFAPAGGNGLDISTTTGTGFSALGGGTISVSGAGNTVVSSGGAALDVNAAIGAGGLNFATTSSGGGVRNVKLTNATGGAIALGGGTLAGSTGAAFLVGDGAGGASTGGTSAITYGGSITSTGAARAVDIQDRAAGAGNIALSGTITHSSGNASVIFIDDNAAGTIAFSGTNSVANGGTSTAVSLTDNTGTTISFTGGGLDIDATGATGSGFVATGGGTVNVTGTGNTITTTTSAALTVTSTTIGASGMTWQTINSNGATKGITLNATGAGSFTVAGTGSAGSGGTIQNATNRGAEFISVSSVTLNNLTLNNNGIGASNVNCGNALGATVTGTFVTDTSCISNLHLQTVTTGVLSGVTINNSDGHGINGYQVSNLTLSNVSVELNGNEVGEDGVQLVNSGNVTVNGTNTFRDSASNQFEAQNGSGTSVFTISGSFFGLTNFPTTGAAEAPSPGASVANSGLLISGSGTANMTVTVTGSTFDENYANGYLSDTAGSATMNITVGTAVSGNTFTNNGVPIEIVNASTGSMTYVVRNNTVTNATAITGTFATTAIVAARSGAGSLMTGTIDDNTIGTPGVVNSGCFVILCDGISLPDSATSSANGYHVTVTNNAINHVQGGITSNIGGVSGGAPRTSFVITGNTVGNPDSAGSPLQNNNGILINSGTLPDNVPQTCVEISGNTMSGNWGLAFNDDSIRYRHRGAAGSAFRVRNFTTGGDIDAFVTGINTAGAGTVDLFGFQLVGSNVFTGGTAACPQ